MRVESSCYVIFDEGALHSKDGRKKNDSKVRCCSFPLIFNIIIIIIIISYQSQLDSVCSEQKIEVSSMFNFLCSCKEKPKAKKEKEDFGMKSFDIV